MDKIIIEKTENEEWICYDAEDAQKTIKGSGSNPFKALEGLATAIKFFN